MEGLLKCSIQVLAWQQRTLNVESCVFLQNVIWEMRRSPLRMLWESSKTIQRVG